MTSLAAPHAPSPAALAAEGHLPTAAAARVAMDFLLDHLIAGLQVHDGDLLSMLVLAALSSGNCAHLPAEQFATLDKAPPDRERRPLTIRQVAQSLGQPYETVRRRFVALEASGQIVRRGRNGFIVPETADNTPERRDAARRTHAKVQRMMKTLQAFERRSA
jgi:predicted transcriptional regulator